MQLNPFIHLIHKFVIFLFINNLEILVKNIDE